MRRTHKWSAVAEMGDRLATIDMDQKLRGGAVPLGAGGAWSSSNAMWPGRDLPPNASQPSSHLATIDIGRGLYGDWRHVATGWNALVKIECYRQE